MSKITRAIAAVVLATGFVAGGIAFPSTAGAAEEGIVIRKVDTSAFPDVKLTVLRPPVAAADEPIVVTENGTAVSNPVVQTTNEAGVPVGIVMVLDTSNAMKDNNALDKTKAAALDLVAVKKPNEKIAVVVTNNGTRPVMNFTSDAGLLTEAINKIEASGDSALWQGTQIAAGLLTEAPELQPNVVVVSGSTDRLSEDGTFTAGKAQLSSAKATVFTIGLRQREQIQASNLQVLASATNGRYFETTDPLALTQIFAGIERNLATQSVVSYRSTNSGALDISVGIGNANADAHVSPGTISEGAAVNPKVIAESPVPEFLQGLGGLILVALFSLLGVGILVYGIIETISKDRKGLSSALRPYSDEEAVEKTDFSKLADSAFIKKAVAETARIADNRGFLEFTRKRLEQADLPLKPAEALFFTAAIAIFAMLVASVFLGFLGFMAAGFVFAYLPFAVTSFLAKRRKRRFTSQLPDILQLLSGSLRAGYSLIQGLDAVSKQAEEPMAGELQRAMSEARLGRPVELALQDISDRMNSDDFEWAVMAIKIQREVGGNLAELLMTVSETMIQRERLRREVSALTAEGRISAIVLSMLPPIIGVLIAVMNPAYMEPLFSQFIGQLALGVAGVMIVVGYLTMNKLTQIEA